MRSLPSPSLARSTILARITSRYGDVYSFDPSLQFGPLLFGEFDHEGASSRSGNSRVSAIRNDTIHEAIYSGEPLGFGLYGVGTNENLRWKCKHLFAGY